MVIPGSYRNRHDAVDGSTVMLTLDDDIQFYVQQQVQQAKNLSGAKNVSAVVLDAKTGEVLAMSNDNTFDPSQDIGRQEDRELGNLSVSSPYEPGSVNKIVTAASVIEYGLSNPDEVLQVPGEIDMGGVSVHDAWEHGVMPYTTTGIFGKSSNVGTLMLAQRIGPERYAEMLEQVRPRPAHRRRAAGRERGPGAADRPVVGQHVRQPAYRPRPFDDTAADDEHVPDDRQRRCAHPAAHHQDHHRRRRHPHRRAKAARACGWCRRKPRRPCGRCCARRCNAIRRGDQQGTGPQAAVDGYQVSGKTGTAQQINPGCGCYYDEVYWITFAGMAPTDDPRYVVGIMADNPQRTAEGQRGTTMAPLFHNIMAWLVAAGERAAVTRPRPAADASSRLSEAGSPRVRGERPSQAGTVSWP